MPRGRTSGIHDHAGDRTDEGRQDEWQRRQSRLRERPNPRYCFESTVYLIQETTLVGSTPNYQNTGGD